MEQIIVIPSTLSDHAQAEAEGKDVALLRIDSRQSRTLKDCNSHQHVGKYRLVLQEIANCLQGGAISAAKDGIRDILHSPILKVASGDKVLNSLYSELFQHARIATYVSGKDVRQATAPKLNWDQTKAKLAETGTLGKVIDLGKNDVPYVYDVISRLYDWSFTLQVEGKPVEIDYNPFAEGKSTRERTTFATVLSNGLTIGQYLSKAIAGNANKLDWRFYAEHCRKDATLTELEKDRITRLLTGEKADANAKK